MQSNLVSRHKFLLLCMAFCTAMLAPSYDAKASALGIGDSHELGFLWPGIQKKTANQDKVNYVNHLIGMALGTIEIAKGEVYFRSSHGFKILPAAAQALNGGGRTFKFWLVWFKSYLLADVHRYRSGAVV